MQFSCESCKAQLQIADEKVKGRRLIVRCRRCGAKIAIADPSLSKAPPRLVQPPAAGAPGPMRVSPQAQPAAPTNATPRPGTDTDDTRAMESEVLEKALQASKAAEPPSNGAPSRPPPPPVAAPVDAPTWFAMLQGKQSGPLTRAEVEAKSNDGEIGPRTYLWKEGMSAWQRAKDVPELIGLFPQPAGPPLPPPLPVASSAPPPPPGRPPVSLDPMLRKPPATEVEARRIAGLAPEPRKPSVTGELPARKAREERTSPSAIDANLSQPSRPAEDPALGAAAQKKAADLARWASEELAKRSLVPEQPSQAPPPTMFASAAPARKGGTLLVFVVLAVLAAAALALWIAFADKDKEPPRSGERSESAPAGLRPSPSALPAGGAHAEASEAAATDRKPAPLAPGIGLTADQVRRKIDESKGALQGCIDEALRREPGLRVGKIHIATTIAPSGQVTSARIDQRPVDASSLGACLKRTTRRIAFPAFGGDAFDVDIPIVVTAGE